MRQDAVGIAKQSGTGAGGLGTEQTTMEYWLPVETAERGPQIETMDAEETLGVPFPSEIERGVRYFEPSLTGKCRGASLPRILAAFWGDPTTTTPDGALAPTARNHQFLPSTATGLVPRAVSIAMLNRLIATGADDVDLYTILWDAIGQEITLAVETNEWINFDASFVAKAYDDAASIPTPSYDGSRRFPFYECKAYASINGGAETEIKVSDFSLTFQANVPTDVAVLGSQDLFRVRPGNRDGELKFTPMGDVTDWYKRAVALGDQDNCKLRLEALGPTIGGAVKHKVELIAYNAQVEEAGLDIDAGEVLNGVEVTAQAAYDKTTSKFLEANIVNTVAAY